MATTREWVLLAYRIPREPSTPRIAVWRRLRRLGAAQLLDGLVALPLEARTKEHFEWIADEVEAAGGEATIWLARPATKAQERDLAAQMAREAEAEYDAVVEEARAARRDDPAGRRRTAARLHRELQRIRQRDYFPKGGFERAVAAVERLDAAADAEAVRR